MPLFKREYPHEQIPAFKTFIIATPLMAHGIASLTKLIFDDILELAMP
jgi:hypothetical protein